jgi:hypothetical protein
MVSCRRLQTSSWRRRSDFARLSSVWLRTLAKCARWTSLCGVHRACAGVAAGLTLIEGKKLLPTNFFGHNIFGRT